MNLLQCPLGAICLGVLLLGNQQASAQSAAEMLYDSARLGKLANIYGDSAGPAIVVSALKERYGAKDAMFFGDYCGRFGSQLVVDAIKFLDRYHSGAGGNGAKQRFEETVTNLRRMCPDGMFSKGPTESLLRLTSDLETIYQSLQPNSTWVIRQSSKDGLQVSCAEYIASDWFTIRQDERRQTFLANKSVDTITRDDVEFLKSTLPEACRKLDSSALIAGSAKYAAAIVAARALDAQLIAAQEADAEAAERQRLATAEQAIANEQESRRRQTQEERDRREAEVASRAKQAAAEAAASARQAAAAAQSRAVAQIKAGKRTPNNIIEAALATDSSGRNAFSVAKNPKLEPDNLFYFGTAIIDERLAVDRIRLRLTVTSLAITLFVDAQLVDTTIYLELRLLPESAKRNWSNARIGQPVSFVARYIDNQKYQTLGGGTRTVPVFNSYFVCVPTGAESDSC